MIEVNPKPRVALIGADGNIFNLIGLASRTLEKTGHREASKEMTNRIMQCDSYDSALQIIMDYVEVK